MLSVFLPELKPRYWRLTQVKKKEVTRQVLRSGVFPVHQLKPTMAPGQYRTGFASVSSSYADVPSIIYIGLHQAGFSSLTLNRFFQTHFEQTLVMLLTRVFTASSLVLLLAVFYALPRALVSRNEADVAACGRPALSEQVSHAQ